MAILLFNDFCAYSHGFTEMESLEHYIIVMNAMKDIIPDVEIPEFDFTNAKRRLSTGATKAHEMLMMAHLAYGTFITEGIRSSFEKVPVIALRCGKLMNYIKVDLLNGDYALTEFCPFNSAIVICFIRNCITNLQPYVDLFFKSENPSVIRHLLTALPPSAIEPTYQEKLDQISLGACILDVIGPYKPQALYQSQNYKEVLIYGISVDLLKIIEAEDSETLKKYVDAITLVPAFGRLVVQTASSTDSLQYLKHVLKLIEYFPALEKPLREAFFKE
jgi:hypothetical protein